MAFASTTTLPPTGSHRLGGIACIVLALACFGALDTSSKVATATVPVVMAIWARCLIQTAATWAVLWPSMRSRLFHTRRPGAQVLRGLLLISTNSIAYVSLAHMPVGEFTAIIMLTPLLLTVLAAWSLHEPVSPLRWLCVGAGFVGTLVVIRPGADIFDWASLLPLLLVACSAAYQLLTRSMARRDEPGTIHFYSGLTGLVVTSALLPFFWRALPAGAWWLLALLGVLGTLGHFLLIMAYQRAPVARLTPYLYLQIFFAALGGWIVFAHVPDAWSLAGIGLIVVSGVFGTWLTGREVLHPSSAGEAQSSIEAIAGADER
jgi:drug/metabolite transporter (DMT)-like permease